MVRPTATLLDPFEISARPVRPLMPTLVDPVEEVVVDEMWDEITVPFSISHAAIVEESSESPPWTPEPVDRRWRARGWTDSVLER